jgi:tripartite-type tricarboxylate transporter receptor subunit TctC
MYRRNAIITIAIGALACVAQAQTSSVASGYPAKPVRIVVPYPAGGTFDATARVVAEKLQAKWNQPVVVDNKPGANGMIAFNLVARAEPDGYTLLIVGTSLVLNYATFKSLNYKVEDFTAVAGLVDMPYAVAVRKDLPVGNMKELIANVKAAQGKFSIGNAGASERIASQRLRDKEGLQFVDVPYPGTAALVTAVAGGQVDAAITAAGTLKAMETSGRVKIIAVTGEKRVDAMQGVPTVLEAGYQSGDLASWVGLVAPQKTDRAIVQKISADVVEVMKNKDVIDRLSAQVLLPNVRDSAAFDKFLKSEYIRWTESARAAGISPE